MTRHIPGLALVQAELDEVQRRLDAEPTYTASQWDDIQPARMLLESRRDYLIELEASLFRASNFAGCSSVNSPDGYLMGPDECTFAPLSDPSPHRQNFTPQPLPPAWRWKVLMAIGLVMMLTAGALQYFEVLTQ